MNVRFDCPVCECPGRIDTADNAEWHCPQCDHLITPHPQPLSPEGRGGKELPSPLGGEGLGVRGTNAADNALPACAVCGNGELYRKKDFPHSLGMAILVLACLASTVTYWLYHNWLTWAILIGSAAFDGLLYLWVKDVIVCYRCQAHHRGVPANAEYPPFELTIHERYRQERLRREQLKNSP